MNNSKRIYRAAIYVRLSKEDGDLDDVRKAESNSISNQKSLILNYLKDKEDIEIVSIREDDGYSGATFDRPAFKLMMQDVKDGIIDCIVVKDLSRFAREYIDAGRYIERMFPAMGIRFIAINDAYDSADTQAQGNEIIIPFKNLINDAYCRDGIVDKSDFAIIKESFEVKRSEAEKAIDRLQKEAENIAAGIERDTEWLEEHRKWKTMPSLTRNVVVSLIQSVKVYEGGDIEIVLDCDDEYRKIVARAGELEKQQDTERLVV